MTSALHLDSSVHGYHVYSETWIAVFGEILCTERELHNVMDRYAVAVTKDSGNCPFFRFRYSESDISTTKARKNLIRVPTF